MEPRVYLRQKWTRYLGELRPIHDIYVGNEIFVSPTPSVTPPVTPTSTPLITQTNTPSVTQTNTPSVTQTNTPSVTQTSTQTNTPTVTIGLTPTMTPSNSPTPSVTTTNTPSNSPTPSITPSPTSTSPDYCPEQMYVENTNLTISGITGATGIYTRTYSWSGGSFNYGYFDYPDFILGPDLSGKTAAVYQRYNAIENTYWQSMAVVVAGPPYPVITRWTVFRSFGDYWINGGSYNANEAFVWTQNLTTSNGITYPTKGYGSIRGYFSYPSNCPTATPTQTQTNTPSITPSNSPTQTLTQTSTPSVTPSNTSTPQVSPTSTPTVTSTPSSTPPNYVCYYFQNEDSVSSTIFYYGIFAGSTSEVLTAGNSVERCVDPNQFAPYYTGGVTTIGACSSATSCTDDGTCEGCT